MTLNLLICSKSFESHEKHSTNILQYINKFLFCNLFTPKIATINIKDASDSMAITSILNIIINTQHYSNEYIIETILNSHPKIIKNIVKVVNCSSSGAILNLEITDHKVRSIFVIKQDVDLMTEPRQAVLDPIKSQIQLLHTLYNDSYDELKEMYISNPFAHQYFTYLCNSYKPGKYNVKCRVMISPEELAGNNIVNLLKIITKCEGDNDILEEVHDYAQECTIKITEKELEAVFAMLAAYQLANINYEVLNKCQNIANTIPLAKDNAGTDNCNGPNEDIASSNQTIKVLNNVAIKNGNKVYLSNTDNLSSDFNTLQVPAAVEIVGYSNLAFDHHLDEY